jgi:TPR repeat protein
LDAYYALSRLYEEGKGVPQDIELGRTYLQKAANGGQRGAQLEVGHRYKMGSHGFPQDNKEAFRFYKMAAEAGVADAQYFLSECYEMGRGCVKNAF